jgi:MoxR-like ATPase
MAASLRQAIADSANGLVERETLVELIVLAAVAQEHLLVIGPPGMRIRTAKLPQD